MPTGDPNCPPHVRFAKRIWKKIVGVTDGPTSTSDNVDMTSDDKEEDEDDDNEPVDAEDDEFDNNRSDVKEYGDCKLLFDARGSTEDEENQQLYPNSNAMLLTIYQSKLIEIACVCLIALYIILEFADDGFIPRLFFYPGEKRPIHTVQCIVSVCLLRNAISNDYASATSSPFLRWLILGSFLRRNRRELWTYKNIVSNQVMIG